MVAVIEIADLVFTYDRKTNAVDNVTFSVGAGEILGVLGPNGAGKSTVVKMITGMLRPTSGSIKVSRLEVSQNLGAVRKIIGFMPQETALYQDLTAQETLEYHADIYGVPKDKKGERIEEMLELAGLTKRKDDLVKSYSGGMKRRLALVRTLLHESSLIILDEMSLGVDVQSRNLIWQQVKELKRLGKTVLFCTNYMDEADALADRVIVLDRGKIVAQGSPRELKREHAGNYLIEVGLEGLKEGQDKDWLSSTLGMKVEKLTQIEDSSTTTAWIRSDHGHSDLPSVIKTLIEQGLVVRQAAMREPSLGDVFLAITGSKLRD